MSQMQFDERVAAQLDVVYRSRDMVRRRELVLEGLAVRPGDRILDLGCGPGYYVADVLERVGEHGCVVGVDTSEPMLAIARERTAGRPNVELLSGGAERIPCDVASVDSALSVQVFEYLPDVDGALAELMRVVRPGGRIVIWDIDWSTLSWHSSDPQRMRAVLDLWDRHLHDPVLPRTLAASLRRSGFEDVARDPFVFSTTAMDPQSYGGALPFIVQQYATTLGDADTESVAAWLEDLRALDAAGAYSCSVVHFRFSATRPA